MRRERSRLKDLTREGRITAKDYTLFSMETKEMENGNKGNGKWKQRKWKMETKEEKFHDFHL
jgi:hypothetical protein